MPFTKGHKFYGDLSKSNYFKKGWKLIKMSKDFTSQEALDEIKGQGYRPANVYELALFANTYREKEMPKGVWSSVIAFGSDWYDDGDQRVPGVNRDSDGDFEFLLGYFEFPWYDDNCLLAFCDKKELGRFVSWKL